MNSSSSFHSYLKSIQEDKFNEVIPHFWDTPLIEQNLKKHGIDKNDFISLSQIPDLPFMSKSDLRGSSIQDRSPFELDQLEYIFSSNGTTGEPTYYFWTKDDTTVLQLAGRLVMERVGLTSNDLAMIIAPTGLPIMSYCMNNQYRLLNVGVLPIGIQPPEIILEALQKLPVSIMTTLPVFCTRLIEFHLMNKVDKTAPWNLKQCHVGGDFLSEGRRNRIEEMWNADCYNFFGMSEIIGPIAGECKEKNGMHFLSEYVYLEVLDPETRLPVLEGEAGIAVYTTLWKKGAPLLRYWSGDFVSVLPGECQCGDNNPRIKFLGRAEESVVLSGRRIFPSELEDFLFQFPVGSEYSLELKLPSTGLLKVEKLPEIDLPLKHIEQAISNFLGLECTVWVLDPGTFSRGIPKPKRIIFHH